MDWFKRYGVPGAYSMGLTLVWLIILYPLKINLIEEETLKIVGGIFAGGFLPFGYLICIAGEAYYTFRCCFSISRRYGRHARARFIADANHCGADPVDINDWNRWVLEGIPDTQNPILKWLLGFWLLLPLRWLLGWFLRWQMHQKEMMLEPCSVLVAVSNINNKWTFEKEKYIQEWIRKRNDVVVMNQAIMAGTIFCTIGVFGLQYLPSWSMQPSEDQYWIWFLSAVICLQLTIWYMTIITRIKIDILLAGVFDLRRKSKRALWQSGRGMRLLKPRTL